MSPRTMKPNEYDPPRRFHRKDVDTPLVRSCLFFLMSFNLECTRHEIENDEPNDSHCHFHTNGVDAPLVHSYLFLIW